MNISYAIMMGDVINIITSIYLHEYRIYVHKLYNSMVKTFMPYYACFEWNLQNQISCGDSVQSTTFCGNQVVDTTFFVPWPIMTSQ